MSFINLSDYISQGGILKNLSLSGQFDCIVYEQFIKDGFEIPEGVTLRTFQELRFEKNLSGLVSGLQEHYRSILLILDQTHWSELIPILEQSSSEGSINLHGIALHSGISGLLSGIGTRNTLSAMATHTPCTIHDPFDVPSFFSGLEESGIHVHMIHDGDYISNVFESSPETRSPEGMHSLTSFGFSGYHGTIVTSGRVSAEVIGTLQLLQEQDVYYDLFVSQLGIPVLTQELRERLIATEKLIVITDQSYQVMYTLLMAQLAVAGLSEVSLEIITPDTDSIVTTQWEHLYQQAHFSREFLVEKLQSHT